MTIENAVKLAGATDPRSSSIAVYDAANKGTWIWGLVDQASRYYDFLNFD